MGAHSIALNTRASGAGLPLRMLHGWHLLSLDAPTVAFCWVLLFAQTMHVPHAFVPAAALACAVWLVYAADRLLDAWREKAISRTSAAPSALFRLYREHAPAFLFAGLAVGVATVALLAGVPRSLAEAWLWLAAPLALYAVAVHVLHLPGRWKAVCVAVFFSIAVALPVAVSGGAGWPLAAASVAFGGVCRANCAVLRAASRRLRIVLALSTGAALLPLRFAETRAVALACLASVLLLSLLVRTRQTACARAGSLGWRALVDAALVLPAIAAAAVAAFVH